jgi:NhaA family Na+:H+ antiporter
MARHREHSDTGQPDRHSLARSARWATLARDERVGGIAMSIGAIAAVAWASFGASSYHAAWDHRFDLAILHLGAAGALLSKPRSLVDQGAMTLFFLAVGMELARERSTGMLAHLRHATVPVLAALSGMAGAAGTYLLVARSGPAEAGFGVPMATDIAFVAGAAGLLGQRLPPSLRIFLVSLAVADDIGSVGVLAVVSGHEVSPLPLVLLALLVALLALVRRRVRTPWPAVASVVAFWGLLALAHVEPALAGVVAGALVPRGIHRLEREVATISGWIVLPAFSLANAGVDLFHPILANRPAATVFAAILVARIVGKTLGVSLGATGATRLWNPSRPGRFAAASAGRRGLGRALPGAGFLQLLGASSLTGMGFTVPLLFAHISFANHPLLLDSAKAGLLVGSLASGLIGTGALSLLAARTAR